MTTRQELINAIEKECQKANPDLLKLEFGCRIRSKKDGSTQRYVGEVGTYTKTCENSQSQIITLHQAENEYIDDEKFKILGKEPQLADVLLAINERSVKPSKESALHGQKALLCIQENGRFAAIYNNHGFFSELSDDSKKPLYWNLNKGLYGQTNEVLQFIVNLLGNSLLD